VRIMYIHQYFCTRNGRTGTRSYEFARYLVRSGHRVTMITSTSDISDITLPEGKRTGRMQIDGIDTILVRVGYSQRMGPLARMLSFAQFMVLSCWIAIRESGHDVVIATSTPLTVGIPGMLAGWYHRIPFVFEVRDLWPEAPIQMAVVRNRALILALRMLERLIYRASHHVIALSPGMRSAIVGSGVHRDKVTVIPNCSDLDLFQPGLADIVLKKRFDLEGKFVAIHAGSVGEINGIDRIVEAASLLQEAGRDDIRFLLVGQGRQEAMMRSRVEQRGLRNVIFVGSVPRREVPAYLRTADLCLVTVKDIPVLATASPNKMFDALAAGRPILVNCSGWMRDLVRDHDIGRAVEAGSGQAIAEAVVWFADHRAETQRMGMQARRLAEEQFDRLKLAAEFEDVLLAAAGHPRPDSRTPAVQPIVEPQAAPEPEPASPELETVHRA
jgi:glycosyltransferase involved in cell wall biosynthesis